MSLGESYSEMYAKSYATITTWPQGATASNVQRNDITGGAWPTGEIDINTSRYVQFAIKAETGSKLIVDSVGLYAGGAGGSNLKYRILYSTNESFSNPVTLDNKIANTSNTMVSLSYKPMVLLDDNEGFYLRFYPWYSTSATYKYLSLSNLIIKGKVSSLQSGVNNPKATQFVVYPNPSKGVFNMQLKGSPINQLEVFSGTGVLVKKQAIDSNNATIDLTKNQNGLYIIKMRSVESTETVLLIKN
jgi:hypothetical protein